MTSAADARRRVYEELAARRLGPRLADDVALVVSELVANSVRHAAPLPGGELELSWDVRGSVVVLKVTDGGGQARPVPRRVGPDDISGRGLSIVAKVAADWGVADSPGATTVWAIVTGRPPTGNGARPPT